MSEQITQMQAQVVSWRTHILPSPDPIRTAVKLVEEASELINALYAEPAMIADEVADCLILLLDIASIKGIDVEAAFHKKMMINKARSWIRKDGSMSHL